MEGNGGVKNGRKRKSEDGGTTEERTVKPTQQMILKWHDVWTKVTMSGLFDEVQRQSLTDEQLEEWVRFRLLLAGRLVLTCSRLKKAGLELPCIKIVEEDNQWMVKFAKDLGINASPKSARLAQIGEMIEYLDRITVLEADTIPAGFGIWAVLFSCWQGWNLTLERARSSMDDTFLNVASFLAREEKIVPLLETANMLDEKITPNQLKACEDVFCKALQRVSDFYEEMLFQGWTENSLRCKKCGRYGHTDAKCLFKAKASRAT